MDTNHLQTPTFLVNWEKTQHNAQQMITKAKANHVVLRPHVKTHKTAEIATIQTENVGKPITVSTISECIFFQQQGFRDIFLAFPITYKKCVYLHEQLKSLEQIRLLTDSLDVCKELEVFAGENRLTLDIRIKINSGADRAGLTPCSSELLDLARWIKQAEYLHFEGLVTHAGHAYAHSSAEEKKAIAEQEVKSIVESARFLENHGIVVKTRSIGSTPTLMQDADLKGITEIRPGNYIWFDVFQYNRGNCALDDIACSVLTSVIGVYPERETILIDAGALALSKDTGFWDVGKTRYGLIKNHPELEITGLSQEHGIIKASLEVCKQFKVGDLLEIFPNHSCLTAACFPYYEKVENGLVSGRLKPAKFWIDSL